MNIWCGSNRLKHVLVVFISLEPFLKRFFHMLYVFLNGKRCCFRKSQASAVFVSDDIHTQLYTIYWYNIIYIYMFVSFPVFLSLTVSIPCHSQTEPAIGSSSLKPPSLIPTVYTRPLPSAPMCCSDRVPPGLTHVPFKIGRKWQ